MACWLRLGCWSNNFANSHLSPGTFNRRLVRSCLVLQCSYLPYRPRHQQHLANCDWMPAPYTSRQPSYPRRHPTCWASSPRSHTVSSTLCHGVLTPAPLSAYLSIESKCTAPQIKIPICTHRTTTHQFIWQQQHMCGTLGRSPMECRVSGNPIRLHTFISDTGTHLLRITLPRRAWVQLSRLYTGVRSFRSCLYKCGTGLPAACECGVERTNCRPCCPLMSNPSTSSWTARPDSSGRWDNRMAAQHLPQKYGLAVVMKSWLNRRTSVLGSGSQSTRSPSISCQVNGLLGQGEINAG